MRAALALALAVAVASFATVADASEIAMPDLTPAADNGASAYGVFCGECHGAELGGSGEGPPLVHKFYEPGHHGDASFWRAVRNGSPQHHWRFGDMKPVAGVTDAELASIIIFVREVQAANGIR